MGQVISVKGNKRYIQLFKALAAKRGTTVAQLVRHALDTVYGDELSNIEDFFIANDDAHTHHNVDTRGAQR